MIVLELTDVTDGLSFPEGPVAMPDGSVVVVEMFGERITRVTPDGTTSTITEAPGGPNGLAVGPDDLLYLCNNGGTFTPVDIGGAVIPGPIDFDRYRGGSVQRIEADGSLTTLYTECDGHPLRGPNDLVMDGAGGFYFTDHGIIDRGRRTTDLSGIYYARCDGSSIVEVAFPTHEPNGIGLSPDGSTLYYAETYTSRLYRRTIESAGVLAPGGDVLDAAAVVASLPGLQYLDSLAVDGDGNICVGTLLNGGITVFGPDGSIEHVAVGDLLPTNLCFGGVDLTTVWVTLSGTGRLARGTWTRPGLQLAHQVLPAT